LNNKVTSAHLVFAAIYILFWPALTLFISGDWLWLEGWIFGVWFVLMSVIITTYLYLRDPDLLAERFRMQGTGNQKTWDKYFMFLIALMFLGWIIIMPLDAKRLRWSNHFPTLLKIIGVTLLLVSFYFLFRSFKDNTFCPH
jgi:uncharacterized membrane protein